MKNIFVLVEGFGKNKSEKADRLCSILERRIKNIETDIWPSIDCLEKYIRNQEKPDLIITNGLCYTYDEKFKRASLRDCLQEIKKIEKRFQVPVIFAPYLFRYLTPYFVKRKLHAN